MQKGNVVKDEIYHESAIKYNEELADYATQLSQRIEHKEVARWSRAVAKQHTLHAGLHQKALDRLKNSSNAPAPEATEEQISHEPSVAQQQADYAAEQESLEVGPTGSPGETAVSTLDPMDADTNGLGENPAGENEENNA